MLENERIIVDRGGIDPGIAALMQNANKGFDPAALMAMMNNGNGMFGGNGGWWWIFIIVLFWMWGGWGGNGFGGNRNVGAGAVDGYILTSDFANLERKLDGVNNGLCDGFYAQAQLVNGVQQNLSNGFMSAEISRVYFVALSVLNQ